MAATKVRRDRVSAQTDPKDARSVRWGMIVVGLVIWAVAIAWPGWSLPGVLLGSAMVAWATFGLLTEP